MKDTQQGRQEDCLLLPPTPLYTCWSRSPSSSEDRPVLVFLVAVCSLSATGSVHFITESRHRLLVRAKCQTKLSTIWQLFSVFRKHKLQPPLNMPTQHTARQPHAHHSATGGSSRQSLGRAIRPSAAPARLHHPTTSTTNSPA